MKKTMKTNEAVKYMGDALKDYDRDILIEMILLLASHVKGLETKVFQAANDGFIFMPNIRRK